VNARPRLDCRSANCPGPVRWPHSLPAHTSPLPHPYPTYSFSIQLLACQQSPPHAVAASASCRTASNRGRGEGRDHSFQRRPSCGFVSVDRKLARKHAIARHARAARYEVHFRDDERHRARRRGDHSLSRATMDKCLRRTSLIFRVMAATKTRLPPRSVVRITMTLDGLARCAVQPVGQDGPDQFRRGSDGRGACELHHGRENAAAWWEGTTRRIRDQVRPASTKCRTAVSNAWTPATTRFDGVPSARLFLRKQRRGGTK
jgi:hypothetical protein